MTILSTGSLIVLAAFSAILVAQRFRRSSLDPKQIALERTSNLREANMKLEDEKATSDPYKEANILFADIANFTPLP